MTLRKYLMAVSRLAAECARERRLLPVFLRIARWIPSTVTELLKREAKIAA